MKEKGKKRIGVILAVLYLLVCVGLYVYIYVIPDITGALKPTVIISYGRLQNVDEAHCVVVREEQPVLAEQSGSVSYYAGETVKTRRSTKVLDIYQAESRSNSYLMPFTGFVSYYIDGLEEVLTPESIAGVTAEQLAAIEAAPEDARKTDVTAGDVLYKIISSDRWYVLALVTPEEQEFYGYKKGLDVTMVFEDAEIPGTVTSVSEGDDGRVVVIETKRFYERFAALRAVDIGIITQDYEGLIVPNSAIGEEDGLKGVYVLGMDGEYDFTRVNIIVSGETESLVSSDTFSEKDAEGNTVNVSTVDIYDEILRDAPGSEKEEEPQEAPEEQPPEEQKENESEE